MPGSVAARQKGRTAPFQCQGSGCTLPAPRWQSQPGRRAALNPVRAWGQGPCSGPGRAKRAPGKPRHHMATGTGPALGPSPHNRRLQAEKANTGSDNGSAQLREEGHPSFTWHAEGSSYADLQACGRWLNQGPGCQECGGGSEQTAAFSHGDQSAFPSTSVFSPETVLCFVSKLLANEILFNKNGPMERPTSRKLKVPPNWLPASG